MDRGCRPWPTRHRARLAAVSGEQDVDDDLQLLVHAGEELGLGCPLAEPLLKGSRLALGLRCSDLLVRGKGLGEERVARKVVDQVKQEAPLTAAPEIA